MEPFAHTLQSLFDQLGLPSDDGSIDAFVSSHKPLDSDIALADAPWWTPAQASFICEALEKDSDWVVVVDHLDAMLR